MLILHYWKNNICKLFVIIVTLFLVSCTASKTLFKSEEYVFKGLEKVTVNQDGSLILSWAQPPANNLQFQIFRRASDSEFDWLSPYKTVSSTSIDLPKYSLNESYCFAVRYNSVDLVADRNTHEVCPPLTQLSDFPGIDSVQVSGLGSVTVSWKPLASVDGIETFGVYLGTGFDTLIASVDANQTSAVVGGLAVDSIYTLGVRAMDSYSRTDTNKKTLSVKVINNSPLTFKGIEKVTQSSATSVVVDWPAPAGVANEFRIFRWSGAPGDTPVVDFNSPATTAAGTLKQTTISNLGDEQKHCFGVRSVSSGSQEDLNTATQCLTFPDNGAPVFAGLQTTQFSGGAAVLNWNAAVGETAKYRVYYQEGTSLNFSTATMVEVAAPAVTHSLTGLPDNRSWTFAVRAVDSRNQIDSNTVTRTSFAGDLTAPSFLGYAGAELVADSETQLTVTFNRSTDIDMSHYSIRGRLTGSGATFMELTTITQQGAGPISKTIPSLLPATSYDILVKAVDTSGNPSTNTSFKTRATLDQTPPTFNGITSVGATPGDISKTRVQWNAATDAGGIKEYRVYYSTQSLVGKTLVRTATYPLNVSGQIINMSTAITSGTQADVTGLNENTNYYFVVHAIDNADNEDSNTSQQQYTVPFYTPPAAPTGLAFAGGAGPSSNRYPFVTGTSIAGYKVKLYVDDVAVSTTAINTSGAFSIQLSLANTTGNYVVKAAHLNPSDVEGVSDTVGTYQLVVDTPVATITGAPTESSMSNATALNVTVGGSNVTQYKFAMLTQATACNATINNYSVTWTDVATPITASTGADGAKRLCVIAKNSGGFEQDITAATERNWTKNTTPPAAPTITAVSDPVTSSTSETYNGVVTVTVNSVAAATHYCAKGNTSEPAAPAAGDSCWTASTTLAAALTSSGGGTTTANTIYAWSKDSASNISTSASTSAGTIDYVNICDSGSLATTCTVSASRTLAAGGATIGGQGNLIVASGGTLSGTVSVRHYLTLLGNLTVEYGGTISANLEVSSVNLTVAGTFRSNGLGFAGVANGAGEGPGGGGGGSSYGGGGGHGGNGGLSIGGGAGGVGGYGSVSSPSQFGSAGGSYHASPGGAGGGAIKIIASGTVTVDGTISSNGALGSSYAGTGSGGSVWIVANLFSGSGLISAKGASGQDVNGGSGGGGRISLAAQNSFRGNVDVSGGPLPTNYGRAGDAGTLYTNYSSICDSGTLSATCTISNTILLGEGASISGSGNLVVGPSGLISSYKPLSSFSIDMSGDVTVQNTGIIRGNITQLSAANVTIQLGGAIHADGYGYFRSFSNQTNNAGTSPGGNSVACGTTAAGGGGSHGGLGGRSHAGNGINGSYMGGGSSYGSNTAPITYGSAGGLCGTIHGGNGGGAITISTSGTLTVAGTLSADASPAPSGGSGGGAGGSLNLQVSTIAGTGTISASGSAGTAGTGSAGGGGGGGRIALTSSNRFSGSINLTGGAAGSAAATAGMPGIAFFTNQDNYCSSGTLSTSCTINKAWSFSNTSTLNGVDLTIGSSGAIHTLPGETMTIEMTGNVTINSGGKILANLTNLSASNLTVSSGGLISADGLGFLAAAGTHGEGTGGGRFHACCGTPGGGGGAHGGAGGNGTGAASGNGAGGSAYGVSAIPITFGSAGAAGGTCWRGGNGGGAIRLTLTGVLTVTGTISANGESAGVGGLCSSYNYTAGGGAGGSIQLITGTLEGAGSILSNGGDGGTFSTSSGGGGGGGGRIAITSPVDTFSGTRTVLGGAGVNTATSGGAGTLELL